MAEKRVYSKLGKALADGEFVLTGELEPEKTCDLSHTIKEAKEMAPYVHAANVTDSPLGIVTINSMAASHIIQREADLEVVWQMTVRDVNKLGIAGMIMGAEALGINNILSLTGDHTAMGDVPESKPVFDLDSATLVQLVREMVDKGSINGHEIESPPKMHVGAAANPNADPMGAEVLKIGRKAEAGVEFIQTQVVYDIDKTIEFLREIKKYDVPVFLGIFPMKSYGMAKGFDTFVPGVDVPKDILARWKDVKKNTTDKKEKKAKYDQLNYEFFNPFITELKKKDLLAGVHCMAVHYTRIFPKLVEVIKA
ncbi:MAG: Bifunctional homocysteine S-methyltransferase/5,10-methylenetetrahydrofolate reductase [Promethearchaeota archaeon]|nr:MAG: Bifunctional homocysteine S-methyltransferase/5,10-methylenetetrahydrofolate reductase [Candidatus Lokiarchaeota archaeon]